MKKFIAYIVFETKLNSSKDKDHYEEITLIIKALDETEATSKANQFIKEYDGYAYIGGNNNTVEKVYTNHITIDEFLGFDEENGVEEINSKSFYDLDSYLEFRKGKIDS